MRDKTYQRIFNYHGTPEEIDRRFRRDKKIMLAIYATTAVLAGVANPILSRHNQKQAEEAAIQYAAQLYPAQRANVSCQGVDSDSNSYVSCSLVVGQDPSVISIECADWAAIGLHGCRAARNVIPVQRR